MELTNRFHSSGRTAYARARDYELRKAIKSKYADAISKASWIERLFLRFEMWCELLEANTKPDKKAHNPSPYALW